MSTDSRVCFFEACKTEHRIQYFGRPAPRAPRAPHASRPRDPQTHAGSPRPIENEKRKPTTTKNKLNFVVPSPQMDICRYYSAPYVVCGGWCVACGVWCGLCAVRCVVCGVWCEVWALMGLKASTFQLNFPFL